MKAHNIDKIPEERVQRIVAEAAETVEDFYPVVDGTGTETELYGEDERLVVRFKTRDVKELQRALIVAENLGLEPFSHSTRNSRHKSDLIKISLGKDLGQ